MVTAPIDCDIHPVVPGIAALMPYLDDHWRETVVRRGIEDLTTIAYPTRNPLSFRQDLRDATGRTATDDVRAARAAALVSGAVVGAVGPCGRAAANAPRDGRFPRGPPRITSVSSKSCPAPTRKVRHWTKHARTSAKRLPSYRKFSTSMMSAAHWSHVE